MTQLVVAARNLAGRVLEAPDLARRWRHVQGVGRRAGELSRLVSATDRDVLVAAAWLHDVGYSARAVDTGLHSLDGARYLERAGWPGRIVALVNHHTCARIEAQERGLGEQHAVYPYEDSIVMDALVTADLTTSPDGDPVSADDRIAEILRRYGVGHPVHRAIQRARGPLLDHVRRVAHRLEVTP